MGRKRERSRGDDDPGVVEWDGGLRLTDSPLWLDARRPVPLCFVSSAKTFRHHQRIITSSGTIEILGDRLGSSEPLSTPMSRPFSVGELVLELYPAGHVIGSSQLLVRRGELTLLYTGGLRLSQSSLTEPCRVRPVDVLVLDCPYDSTPYTFPGAKKVRRELVEWVEHVLSAGDTPVLLASAMGMAQELCRILSPDGEGPPLRAHRQLAPWNRRVRGCGVSLAPTPELRKVVHDGEVVLVPRRFARTSSFDRKVPSPRFALVSGRAIVAEEVERAGAEIGFAASCHADSRELRRFIKQTGARYVYLGPRHTARLEASLRQHGIGVTRFDARRTQSQLELFE